jgi:Chaperone of endosialidase
MKHRFCPHPQPLCLDAVVWAGNPPTLHRSQAWERGARAAGSGGVRANHTPIQQRPISTIQKSRRNIMSSDIKLNDNSVILEGNVGIGTNNPVRPLHVEGNEIHSGGSGAGFSFSDRSKPGLVNNPSNGERWVWYAQDGKARLWSGADVLTINRDGTSWATELEGNLFINKDIFVNGTIRGTVRVDGKLLGRDIGPDKKTNAVQFEANAIQLAPNATDSNPHFALFHELSSNLGKDLLIINYKGGYKQGIKLEGNVQTTGALTQASSIALKENVAELSGREAMATLQGLNAVKYNYKADSQKEQRIGFIAEEVPDLVANSERDRLSPMDLIAVLTKAVQEQQKTITELASEMNTLKQQNGGM